VKQPRKAPKRKAAKRRKAAKPRSVNAPAKPFTVRFAKRAATAIKVAARAAAVSPTAFVKRSVAGELESASGDTDAVIRGYRHGAAPVKPQRTQRVKPQRVKPAKRAKHSLAGSILHAANAIGGTRTRIRLSALRAHLNNWPRADVDRALLELQRTDQLVLMQIDDPTDITPADRAAALQVAGFPRHILYLNGDQRMPTAAATDEQFAALVMSVARRPEVEKFHADRAFIGSIYEHMPHNVAGELAADGLSLDAFKSRLIRLHQSRLLRLTRADLVGAMDPFEVERSEAIYHGASFHFVALD
jgi:hypothetical protein